MDHNETVFMKHALEISKPDVYRVLAAHEYKSLLSLIAEAFAPTMGATKKFRDFCMEYLPEPPSSTLENLTEWAAERQPSTGRRLDWEHGDAW
jgi:hypothetical protein